MRSLFQNHIQPDLDESLANRIDLHMCNREASILEPSPPDTDKNKATKKPATVKTTTPVTRPATRENEPVVEVPMCDSFNPGDITDHSLTQILEKTVVDEATTDDSISTQDSSNVHSSQRRVKLLEFSVAKFKTRQARMCEALKERNAKREADEIDLIKNIKFKTKNIESKDAEKELDRCMTKEDFSRMRICGQFNKGFIVAELDQDLFIIDQHAADEIYNFETLQKAGRIQKQKLLQPKYLELAPSSEHVLIEHLALLEKSGYEMQVCTNRNVGNRIMLTCVPMSAYSNKLLNLKDIDELIYILTETDQGKLTKILISKFSILFPTIISL
jgi:DNA mismatch repair ATPase MutL